VSERQVPFFCPYCGEEDLVPAGEAAGTWECRACTRSFRLHAAASSSSEVPA
jgi:ribosomal protein L37AE/L43A